MFGSGGIVRSYLPIVFLVVLATIAIGVSDSLGMALKIFSIMIWTAVILTIVWIVLFSDIVKEAMLERSLRKEAEKQQVNDEGEEAL